MEDFATRLPDKSRRIFSVSAKRVTVESKNSARDLQTMPAHRDTFSDGCASTYGAEEVAVAAVACVRCPEGIFLEALTAAVEVVDVNDRVWDAALKAWEAWRLRSIL
ncbi:hypothetical protein E4U54_004585 [Claviceps lovelessii]|nr:hypothetical protein E4U54_004585 [Claviceps lovelessii]